MISDAVSGIIGSGGGVFILRGLRGAVVFLGAVVFFGAVFLALTEVFEVVFLADAVFFGAAFLAVVVFFAVAFFGAAFLAVVVFFGAAFVVFFAVVFFAAVAFAVVFLAAGFFTAAFLAVAFFGAAFFTAGFFTAAFLTAGFFIAAFLAVGFFAAGFLVAGFFVAAFFAGAFTASGWARKTMVSSLVTRLAPWLMVERTSGMAQDDYRQYKADRGNRPRLPPRHVQNAAFLCSRPDPMRPLLRRPADQFHVTVHDRPSFCVRCLLTDTVLTRLRRESRDARRIAIQLL